MTRSPARRVRPATSTSADTPRPITDAGLVTRRPSRTAFSTASGSPAARVTGRARSSARSRSRRCCSPVSIRSAVVRAMADADVSVPATMSRLASPVVSSSPRPSSRHRPSRRSAGACRHPSGTPWVSSATISRAAATWSGARYVEPALPSAIDASRSPVAKAVSASSSVGTASGAAPLPAPAADPAPAPGPVPAPVAAGDGCRAARSSCGRRARGRAGRRRPTRPRRGCGARRRARATTRRRPAPRRSPR